MDPNKLLQSILDRAHKISADYSDERGNGIDQDEANALAEMVLNLDQWIDKGGFLPRKWSPPKGWGKIV